MKAELLAFALLPLHLMGQNPTLPLHFSFDSKNFYAAGRWAPSDPKEKAAFPSETEIDCDRPSGTCVEATAEFYSGHPHISVNYWRILKWDQNGITADSSSGICMTGTMVISFSAQTISVSDSEKVMPSDKKEACKFLGASGTNSSVFILKNSKRWNDDPYGESSNKF
jgi:hypothetical protein